MTVVKGEEEDGEEDRHILVGRTAVAGAKQFQACHCDHQRADSGAAAKKMFCFVKVPRIQTCITLKSC